MYGDPATRGSYSPHPIVPAMMILLLVAALIAAILVFTVAQVLRDGYGHPTTIPADRHVGAGDGGALLR
jgi:hypothetical protein